MNVFPYARNSWIVYVVAIFFSLLLSSWIDVREVVINPDGICYLQSAHVMGTEGFQAAIHLCDQSKWPFYPMLIYGLASITKLSYTMSAFTMDAIFSALSVVFFIAIVRLLGGSQRVLWLAAIVILLGHEFNSTRQYIVRDHGFWAFYLISVFFLLHYFRECKTLIALAWGVSSLVAMLFRVEGALLWLLIPFVTFFDKRGKVWWRLGSFLKLNIVTIAFGILLAIWFWTHPNKTVQHLGRLQEVQYQLLHGISVVADGFNNRTQWLGQYVLLSDGARDATIIFIIVLIAGYALNVITNLSLIYASLVAYAWWKKILHTEIYVRNVLRGYVIVNTIITAAFYVENLYLSKRYLIALTVTLMLWIPFALEDFLQRFRLYFSIRKIYWLFPAIAALMIFSSLGGIFQFGYSKTYMREAGDWLANNVPDNAKLYSNDYQVMYYSRHFGNKIFDTAKIYIDPKSVIHGQWKQYDYLALRFNKKDTADSLQVLQEISLQPIQTFSNKRGDQVSIYKVNHS